MQTSCRLSLEDIFVFTRTMQQYAICIVRTFSSAFYPRQKRDDSYCQSQWNLNTRPLVRKQVDFLADKLIFQQLAWMGKWENVTINYIKKI